MNNVKWIQWIDKKKCYRIEENWLSPRQLTLIAAGVLGAVAYSVIQFLIDTSGPIVANAHTIIGLLSLSLFCLSRPMSGDSCRIEISKDFIVFGRWRKRVYDARLPHRFEMTPRKDWFKHPVVNLAFDIGDSRKNFTVINNAEQAETFVKAFQAVEAAVKTGNNTHGRRDPSYKFGLFRWLSLKGGVRTHFLPHAQSYMVDMVYVTPFGRLFSLLSWGLMAIVITRLSMGWRPDTDVIESDTGLILFALLYMFFLLMLCKLALTHMEQIDISKHRIRFREPFHKILGDYDATLPHRFEAIPLPPPHKTPWHKHATLISFYLEDKPVHTMTIWGAKAQEIFDHLQAADEAAQRRVSESRLRQGQLKQRRGSALKRLVQFLPITKEVNPKYLWRH